jgi:hypothetical protein
MTKRISDTKPVLDFIEVATQYCEIIEGRESRTKIKLLKEAFILFPQLCLYGMKLPEIERFNYYDYSELTEISDKMWSEVYTSLKHKLKRWDYYKEMSDPYNKKVKISMYGILSCDLSEIYEDIKLGLMAWENATPARKLSIIWNWKFGFEHHWGDHATSAFRALYSLLYEHLDSKDGDHVGIR